jgi:hypothetical protein
VLIGEFFIGFDRTFGQTAKPSMAGRATRCAPYCSCSTPLEVSLHEMTSATPLTQLNKHDVGTPRFRILQLITSGYLLLFVATPQKYALQPPIVKNASTTKGKYPPFTNPPRLSTSSFL